jgi:hypothetical protein
MSLLSKSKSEDQPFNRTCERCGQPFHCGASLLGCWCMEIKVSDAAHTYMRANYKGCLCRNCLTQFAGPEDTWKIQT